MLSITYDFSDLLQKGSATTQIARTLLPAALDDVTEVVTNHFKSGRYYTTRTGRLSSSVAVDRPTLMQRLVKAKAKHAVYIDKGTRPHMIRFRRARALRFVIGGATLFRRSVFHPGTKARDFSGNETRYVSSTLPDVAESAMARVISAARLA